MNNFHLKLRQLMKGSAKVIDNPDGSWSLGYPDYVSQVEELVLELIGEKEKKPWGEKAKQQHEVFYPHQARNRLRAELRAKVKGESK